jgi:C4-dicarboxylate transporter DctM subunit
MTIFLLVFLLTAIIGFPIAYALGIGAVSTILISGDIPLVLASQRIFVTLNSFTIMAIPFFMLAGELMNTGGITRRIVSFSDALIGHIKGGLAHVNILASMFFAGISGSSAADTSAIGGILIPAMIDKKYDKHFTVAVTCASSCIGPIIPPSIIMIIYGSLTGASVGQLFAAGIIPGILLGISQMLICYYYARKGLYCAPPRERAKVQEIVLTFKKAILPLLMPLVVLGGILGGVFTATEAGVVAVVIGLVLGVFVYKEIKISDLKNILKLSAVRTSQVLLIAAFASIAAWILAKEQFGTHAVSFLYTISSNKTVLFFLMALLYLITGCFVDTIATCLILIPILGPIAAQIGINPLHFATVSVVCIVLGGITPPVAPLLYIASSIAKTNPMKSMKAVLPFLISSIVLVCLLIITPELSLLLPRLLFK